MLAPESDRGRWRLADHVRACRVDDQVILLDLSRSKYLAVGSTRQQLLAHAIDGWPVTAHETQPRTGAADADTLIEQLLAQGLLTRDLASAPISKPLADPVRSLEVEPRPHGLPIGWRRPARLLHSALVSALWLRGRSLADIAASLTARRIPRAADHTPQGPEAIEAAVATYLSCRPFLFTAYDRCLHDSLTLAHFLAGEGLSAAWVIGVRARPFGAHAWVQSDAMVLNDQHERVRRYRPILVV